MFFFDELDRCRPTFALALLESIKHVFSVEGFVFILATDLGQLRSSVEVVYGAEADSGEYLRRFIDIAYRLPEIDPTKFSSFLVQYFELDKCLAGRNLFPPSQDQFYKSFAASLRAFKPSLRQQIQCIDRLSILFKVRRSGSDFVPAYLAFLSVFKETNPRVYGEFVTRRLSGGDLIKWIGELPGMKEFFATDAGIIVQAIILRAGLSKEEAKILKRSQEMKHASNLNHGSVEWQVAGRIASNQDFVLEDFHGFAVAELDLAVGFVRG